MDPDNSTSSSASGSVVVSTSHKLVDIEFPNYSTVLLEHLNQHREEGKFCDLAVHVRGQVFRAHKAVLAASSSYFHDKLLLRNTEVITLPSVIEPEAFAGLLGLIYTGRLRVTVQDMPSYLLVASGLQLWHVVDRCKEVLKREEEQILRTSKSSCERSSTPYRHCCSTSQSPSSSQIQVGSRDETLGFREAHHSIFSSSRVKASTSIKMGKSSNTRVEREAQCRSSYAKKRDHQKNMKTKEKLYHSTDHDDDDYCHSNEITVHTEEDEVEDLEEEETEDDEVIKVHVQSEEDEEEDEDGGVVVMVSGKKEEEGEDDDICSGSIDENGQMVVMEGERRKGKESISGYTYRLVSSQVDSQSLVSPVPVSPVFSVAGLALRETDGGAFSSLGEFRLGGIGTVGTMEAGPVSDQIYVKQERADEHENSTAAIRGSKSTVTSINVVSSVSNSSQLHPSGFGPFQGNFRIEGLSTTTAGGSNDYFLQSTDSGGPGVSSNQSGEPVSLVVTGSNSLGSVVVDSASFPDGTRVVADPTGYPAHAVSQQPMDIHGNEIVTHASLGQTVHAPVKILSVPPDGKRFGCLCGKRFAVKPKRDRHIMLTLSVRPFDCSVCEKKFKLKHHLNEHMKTHLGFLYKCERCGRKFRMRSCYLKHVQQEEEQLNLQQNNCANNTLQSEYSVR
ncbi:ZBTB9 protein, partial [Polypterus senegalus]